MRTLAKIAVVLLFTASGFAQRASFSANASQHAAAHYRNQLSFATTADSGSQHHWYWEDTNSSGNAVPASMDRAVMFATGNDFSPVSLSWTFSG